MVASARRSSVIQDSSVNPDLLAERVRSCEKARSRLRLPPRVGESCEPYEIDRHEHREPELAVDSERVPEQRTGLLEPTLPESNRGEPTERSRLDPPVPARAGKLQILLGDLAPAIDVSQLFVRPG